MIDRISLEKVCRQAILDNASSEFADGIAESTDIFESVDSFVIVQILIETESELEKLINTYIPLGDESLLDAKESPLRRFSSWIDYVSKRIDENG